jgi:hypothetical protein
MLAIQSDKETAEAEARKANARLNAIRDAERLEENKGLLGKTFKYRNSHSCPEKPSDYWWHYTKVQAVDDAGMLTLFQFDTDKYGTIAIGVREHAYNVLGGSIRIPASEFNKAWRALQKKIENTQP